MNSAIKFRLNAEVSAGLGDVISIGGNIFRVLLEDFLFVMQQGDGSGRWKSILHTAQYGSVQTLLLHAMAANPNPQDVLVISAGTSFPDTCTWTYTDEGYYDTSCGEAFVFNYHPVEPQFIGCPYCMKRIQWQEKAILELEEQTA